MDTLKERCIHGVAAACSGLLYWWLLTAFWGHWATVNPIASALLKPDGLHPQYGWMVAPTDWLTSVLVSLPFAVLLVRFAHRHLRLCVAIATASGLLWVQGPGVDLAPALMGRLIQSLLVQLSFLPASVVLVLQARRGFSDGAAPRTLPDGGTM